MRKPSAPPVQVIDAVRAVGRGLVGLSRRLAPPPIPLLELVAGHWRVHALGQVAHLGIADLLAAGTRDVASLAAATGTNVDALFRMMRALAADGILRRDGDCFYLNPISQPLRADHPSSIRHTVIQISSEWNQGAWLRLGWTLRTGKPAFPYVHGMDLWEYFIERPDEGEHFDRSMRELSALDIGPIVAAHDFRRYRRIADIGGGSGQLLAGVLASAPDARGVLYDVERATADASEVLAAAGVADRVEVVNGSFYEAVPDGCDAYMLRQIIHGHDDASAAPVFAALRAVAGEGARVLVLDTLVPERGPNHPGFLDLQMLVGSGGRERTEREMHDLFAANGFRLVEVVRTAALTAIFIAERDDGPRQRQLAESATPAPVVEAPQPPIWVIRLVNPITKRLVALGRGKIAERLLILEFTGRRTGRKYSTPVGHRQIGGRLALLTNSRWRHNFEGGAEVSVVLRGKRVPARAELFSDPAGVAAIYDRLIEEAGWRQAARELGIRINAGRRPTRRELEDVIRISGISVVWVDLHTP